MKLVGRILEFIEASDAPVHRNQSVYTHVVLRLEDVPLRDIQYHAGLLDQAGLIDCLDATEDGFPCVRSLTMKGHDYLDELRSIAIGVPVTQPRV